VELLLKEHPEWIMVGMPNGWQIMDRAAYMRLPLFMRQSNAAAGLVYGQIDNKD
jgi:hypothetical protein